MARKFEDYQSGMQHYMVNQLEEDIIEATENEEYSEQKYDLFVEIFDGSTPIYNPDTEETVNEFYLTFSSVDKAEHLERTKGVGIIFQVPVLQEEEYEFYEENPDEIMCIIRPYKQQLWKQLKEAFNVA